MKPPTINVTEHRQFSFLPEMAGWFTNATKAETLGLYKVQSGGVAPGNFIGVVRIGDCILRVDSKFLRMDCLAMFLDCAAHPVVGGHMGRCLDFWPEEPPIETDNAPDFCGLIAAAFLRELNDLCAHRLRRNFVREEANLVGKAKGKILSAENIRRNLSRGRAERVFCAYQSVSDDILENRILRAALERVAVYLSGADLFRDEQGTLERWVRSCRSHLRGVSVVRVRGGDFLAARSRGAFSHYRRPLHLARAVLESTGFDLDGVNDRAFGVVPFALNSAELFERWVEMKLLEEYPHLQVGRGDISADKGGVVKIRPDFWVPAENGKSAMILDAKYKFAPESIRDILNKKGHDDIYQIVAYSCHRRFLREKLGVKPETEDALKAEGALQLALLYPHIAEDGEGKIIKSESPDKSDTSFHAPFSVWTIPCPKKNGRRKQSPPAPPD